MGIDFRDYQTATVLMIPTLETGELPLSRIFDTGFQGQVVQKVKIAFRRIHQTVIPIDQRNVQIVRITEIVIKELSLIVEIVKVGNIENIFQEIRGTTISVSPRFRFNSRRIVGDFGLIGTAINR